jgi:biopolymer transport protein ExbD
MTIGNGYSSTGLNVEMNVTPLVDVLLVLLIVFMVILPVTPQGLDPQVPQQAEQPESSWGCRNRSAKFLLSGLVIQVVDIGKGAGVTNIGLITRKSGM